MTDCLFCKMIAGQIPVKRVHDDERCIAFHDINPQAPTHLLFVPKQHLATLNDVTVEEESVVGHLFTSAAKFAKANGFAEAGYRCVMNCNADAGQTVFHIHLHVLAGRKLAWPPG